MARPQVADGGTASTYGGQLRIYQISNRRQPTTGGPSAWGLDDVPATPHLKNLAVLRNKHESLVTELILRLVQASDRHKLQVY